jgi:uncharacterized membrane protein YeaQ/YmgE (transglycosylase-associated protein family)
MHIDPGPIILIYYALCAVPGAAAGLLTGFACRLGPAGKLITTIVGAIGGVAGGYLVGTMRTPPPGSGSDALVIGGLVLFTAVCGWLLAFVSARLLRRSGG